MTVRVLKKTTEYIPEWNGNRESSEPIKVTLKRLTQQQIFEYQPLLAKIKQRPADLPEDAIFSPFEGLSKEQMREYGVMLAEVLQANCISITGILDEDDNPVSPIDLLNDGSLMALTSEIISELFSISTLSKQESSELKKSLPSTPLERP